MNYLGGFEESWHFNKYFCLLFYSSPCQTQNTLLFLPLYYLLITCRPNFLWPPPHPHPLPFSFRCVRCFRLPVITGWLQSTSSEEDRGEAVTCDPHWLEAWRLLFHSLAIDFQKTRISPRTRRLFLLAPPPVRFSGVNGESPSHKTVTVKKATSVRPLLLERRLPKVKRQRW